MSKEEFLNRIAETLVDIQKSMLDKAVSYRDANTVKIDNKDDFISFFTPKNLEQPEIHGGFAYAHWCGERALEEEIAKEYGVSIRNIPFDVSGEEGKCIFTGKKSTQRVLFAKSY